METIIILRPQKYFNSYCNIHIVSIFLLLRMAFVSVILCGLDQVLEFAAAAKSRQSCPTLCDPIDGSPPGSRPWDSPSKDTGVGCHFLLQCMKLKSESEIALLCPTLWDRMDCSLPGSSTHEGFLARVLEWGAIALVSQMANLHLN